jgi:hypothetical protein
MVNGKWKAAGRDSNPHNFEISGPDVVPVARNVVCFGRMAGIASNHAASQQVLRSRQHVDDF